MVQDIAREGESNFACSVYNFNNIKNETINEGFVIEAVDFNKPN